MSELNIGDRITIESNQLQALLDNLAKSGFQVIGPTVRDEAVIYDNISSVSELPRGLEDQQDAASYRLMQNGSNAYFGYTTPSQSWKRFLHTPAKRILNIKRLQAGFTSSPNHEAPPKLAFLGVRPCELNAILLQDKALLEHDHADPNYRDRRKNVFIVAVNCGKAGGTCFCASMKTGPAAANGFDLAMTEIIDNDRHYFVVQSGSKEGINILAGLPAKKASEAEKSAAEKITERVNSKMGRSLDIKGLKEILDRNHDNPHWDKIADRCLGCANCTMVCPTCFCTTIEDKTDLVGSQAERWQKWDSCFTLDFSYIHGGSIRASGKSRYRQWMMHKLSAWNDQFGTPGCVGCGRCITWCPAAIDITEEARAIRDGERTRLATVSKKESGNADT